MEVEKLKTLINNFETLLKDDNLSEHQKNLITKELEVLKQDLNLHHIDEVS